MKDYFASPNVPLIIIQALFVATPFLALTDHQLLLQNLVQNVAAEGGNLPAVDK